MLQKYKAKRKLKKNKSFNEAITRQKERLKTTELEINAFADIKDPAEKILELQELKSRIRAGSGMLNKDLGRIAKRKGAKSGWKRFGILMGGAAVVSGPAALLVAPAALVALGPAVVAAEISGLVTADNKAISYQHQMFQEAIQSTGSIQTQISRLDEILDETIKTCDLSEISLSPHFQKAFDNCKPLRDHFTAAVTDAARKAAEDKAKEEAKREEPAAPRKAEKMPQIPRLL